MQKMFKLALVMLPLIFAGNAIAQEAVAITNVRVFDGKKLSKPCTVVIENGLISSKKTAEKTFDGQGATLLPGFIDSHVHIRETKDLEKAAKWGITTMLDMGTFPPELVNSMRNLPGLPQLRSSGVTASAPGSLQIAVMGAPQSSAVKSPEDAQRFVLERQAEGADYIKVIVESPAIMGDKALSLETITSIVTAAHEQHMMVHAHAAYLQAFQIAEDAGADIICHVPVDAPVDSATVKKMKKSKTIAIPTLVMMKGTVDAMKQTNMDYKNSELSVTEMHKAGIIIIAGTDSNNAEGSPVKVEHGRSFHEELELLVAAGLTPLEALRSATVLPAKYLNLKDRGEIKPGLRADLLLVDGDPTKDISTTRNIKAVWINGQPVKNKTTEKKLKIITIEEHFARPGVSVASGQADAGADPELNARLIRDRLADMDEKGIDMQVLSPAPFQNFPPEESVRLSKNANNELYESIKGYPERFAAFAVLPLADPKEAAAELKRTVKDLGFKGAMIYGPTNGIFLDDPKFDPVLKMAAELDVPLYIHPSVPLEPVVEAYYNGFEEETAYRFATSGLGWHYEAGVHVVRMILAGVFDKYPKLQVISGHWGEMIPYYAARLDQRMPQEITKLERKMSEYFTNNVYVTPSGMFTLPPLTLCLQVMGADRIIYSVDTPYIPNDGAREFIENAPIPMEEKEKISSGNVKRLLKIK